MEITKEKFRETKVKKMNENSPASSNSSSSSSTPSSNFTFEGDLLPIDLPSHKWFAFQVEDITKKIHDLVAQYNASVVCLQQVFDEMNLLQEDNLNLKAQTIDLEFLSSASEIEIFSNLSSIPATVNQISDEKMMKKKTDVIPRGAVVPKISVRSKTVSAMNKIVNNQTAAGDSNSSNNAPATTGSKPPHRLRLKDVEQGEEIELEVYKQGMTKTELCNKWEETGVCPYGERCQFAHGVQELRPVIRHPKYKTTICRMITNGGTCPYGHRCHFRHAIDPNEEKEDVEQGEEIELEVYKQGMAEPEIEVCNKWEETGDAVPHGAVVPNISVQSKTVSAMNKIINNQTAAGDSNSSNNAPATTGLKPPHRLRLKNVEQGEEIELEVYKQGMTKTELCNKWVETGVCPYGECCQFAHGVQELRPVIHHPNYKTTICHMITNGGTCPYGHRCHFRHAIDPNEEKEVVL